MANLPEDYQDAENEPERCDPDDVITQEDWDEFHAYVDAHPLEFKDE